MTRIHCFQNCDLRELLSAVGLTLKDVQILPTQEVARRFDAVRAAKPGSWRARCPCHPDRKHKSRAALSISEAR